MHNIKFEQRAVAYVDVLGFKSIVESAPHDPDTNGVLSRLVELLKSAVPRFDSQVNEAVPREAIPAYGCLSDCTILSAPVSIVGPTGIEYDGLAAVVMRAIQVAQLMLDAGLLVRGGIDVGPCWHASDNIVGSAYQNAYLIEAAREHPGIELSHRAKAAWERGPMATSRMCINYRGAFMVNVLEAAYFASVYQPGGIDDTFRRYVRLVEGTLVWARVPLSARAALWLDRRVRKLLPFTKRAASSASRSAKWKWFDQFLRDEATRQSVSLLERIR